MRSLEISDCREIQKSAGLKNHFNKWLMSLSEQDWASVEKTIDGCTEFTELDFQSMKAVKDADSLDPGN